VLLDYNPGECTAAAGHVGFQAQTPACPGCGMLAGSMAWPGVLLAYRTGECTAAARHVGFQPQTPACPGCGRCDRLAWRGVLLAYRPGECTAPAGHGGFGLQTPANKGSGSCKHASVTAWHGVACCSPIVSESARRRCDTAVSGRKSRLTMAVAVVGTLARLPGMTWRAARL